MNQQGKLVDGKVKGGIEWTKTVHSDGSESRGWTWNPVGGCLHACRWVMPDGQIARCYAEDVAEGVASHSYPHGFQHHYWHPERLVEPLRKKRPAKIFLDSMSDLGGHWVPDEQVQAVIDVCHQADWHTFQVLTKNPKRLQGFEWPPNVWVGFSSPPDYMWGQELSLEQKRRKLIVDLQAMAPIEATVKWASIEPLSWDVSELFTDCQLDWAVIGAASHGRLTYQPDPVHLSNILNVLDAQHIPIFYKGNLIADPWREEFPL